LGPSQMLYFSLCFRVSEENQGVVGLAIPKMRGNPEWFLLRHSHDEPMGFFRGKIRSEVAGLRFVGSMVGVEDVGIAGVQMVVVGLPIVGALASFSRRIDGPFSGRGLVQGCRSPGTGKPGQRCSHSGSGKPGRSSSWLCRVQGTFQVAWLWESWLKSGGSGRPPVRWSPG